MNLAFAPAATVALAIAPSSVDKFAAGVEFLLDTVHECMIVECVCCKIQHS